MTHLHCVLCCHSLLPFLTLHLLLQLKRNMLDLIQYLLQILLTPQLLNSNLILPHQHLSYLLFYLRILLICPLDIRGKEVYLFNSRNFVDLLRKGIFFQPIHPFFDIVVVISMLLQVSLKFLVIKFNNLEFLFVEHFTYIIEMVLYALYESQDFLLEIFLTFLRLLQLYLQLFDFGGYLQTKYFFSQLYDGLAFVSYDVVLAVCQGAAKADAFAAGQTYMRGFTEVKGALACGMSDRGLLAFGGSDQASGGQSWAIISFLG